jgi:hypothetical protein
MATLTIAQDSWFCSCGARLKRPHNSIAVAPTTNVPGAVINSTAMPPTADPITSAKNEPLTSRPVNTPSDYFGEPRYTAVLPYTDSSPLPYPTTGVPSISRATTGESPTARCPAAWAKMPILNNMTALASIRL